MPSRNPSLEDAINEEETSAELKKTQLEMLTPSTRKLSKTDMQDLMNGKITKLKHINLEDLVALKNLGNHRMKSGLPLHPHKNLKVDKEGTYHVNIY